jgi:hypothetical protein
LVMPEMYVGSRGAQWPKEGAESDPAKSDPPN